MGNNSTTEDEGGQTIGTMASNIKIDFPTEILTDPAYAMGVIFEVTGIIKFKHPKLGNIFTTIETSNPGSTFKKIKSDGLQKYYGVKNIKKKTIQNLPNSTDIQQIAPQYQEIIQQCIAGDPKAVDAVLFALSKIPSTP